MVIVNTVLFVLSTPILSTQSVLLSMQKTEIQTIGELTQAGYQYESVKDELRRNLTRKIINKETLFPGIIGYDTTVIPALQNAILSKHNIILLGLRGQAKTRITRSLIGFLDEWVPVVKGSPINCHPLKPSCAYSRRLINEYGDKTPIQWRHYSERYHEKLATPDVTIADLIGDIDPIKAAREQRDLTDEEIISFGIIPRSCRGIFGINELPDLQARIQVGLLNILEESDIQIRGFPVRIPMDVMLVFTANPEDYTNRGTIISPLKDRIDSQILTHYPTSVSDSIAITDQEAWTSRDGSGVAVPTFFREVIESVAFTARDSEYVDNTSGVSARLNIAFLENVVSNIERRNMLSKNKCNVPRFADLYLAISALTGKIELTYEGEQDGVIPVALNLIGRSIKQVFHQYLPAIEKEDEQPATADPIFGRIISYFSASNTIELGDETSLAEHQAALAKVPDLETVARKFLDLKSKAEICLGMEFILEGLHQNNLIAKSHLNGLFRYSDLMTTLLG